MKFFKVIIIILLVFCSCFQLSAQRTELGVFLGEGYYLGETNPGKHFLNSKFTGGVYVKRDIGTRIALRLSVNYGTLVGNDSTSMYFPSRDAHFKSNILDTKAMVEINFLPFEVGKNAYYFTPYMVGGLGTVYQLIFAGGFLNDSYISNKNGVFRASDNLQILRKNSSLALTFAFGFGVKYSIAKNISVQAEWLMHKTYVDWLDGVYYYNKNLVNDRYKDIEYICDTSNNDWYSFVQIGISYMFDVAWNKKCIDHLRSF